MNKRFCTACKKEMGVIESTQSENRIDNVLGCGHNFIELNLQETIKVSELFGLRKIGEIKEKFKRGDRPPNVNYAQKFVEYGDIDYEAASVLFEIQDREYDFMNQAAFFCAQATEKYLKAYLFWKSAKHYPGLSGKQVLGEFKKLSHDLEKILAECSKLETEFNQFKSEVNIINKYSLLKYPDVEDEMVYSDGLSISSEILKYVKRIGDFVKELIVSQTT